MSFGDFMSSVFNVVKRPTTAVWRMVTDTAIDGADLITGGKYSDKMDAAKQKLTDVGISSLSDSINDGFYPELKTMAAEVTTRKDALITLADTVKTTAKTHDDTVTKANQMLLDIIGLAEISSKAEVAYAEAVKTPDWPILHVNADAAIDTLKNLKTTCETWHKVCLGIKITQGVVGTADLLAMSMPAIIAGLGRVSAALSSTKVLETATTVGEAARTGELGLKGVGEGLEVAATIGKMAKIGKLAGKAAGPLFVLSIALDVGMTVAQSEEEKTLRDNLDELNGGITDANQTIADLTADTTRVKARIQELLAVTQPPVQEGAWDGWVVTQAAYYTAARDTLVSVVGISNRATAMAEATRMYTRDQRIQMVQSVDSDITDQQAAQIIDADDLRMKASKKVISQAYRDFVQPRSDGLPSRLVHKSFAGHVLQPYVLNDGRPFDGEWWLQAVKEQVRYEETGKQSDNLRMLDHLIDQLV